MELLAECSSFFERGDALLSVLGDFGGTCGLGSSISLSLDGVQVSKVSCDCVLEGITSGASSSQRFLEPTLLIAFSGGLAMCKASETFPALAS